MLANIALQAVQVGVGALQKICGESSRRIPALKAVVAHYSKDPVWATVRLPLDALPKAQAAKVVQDLEKLGFAMPGLRRETAAA